VIYLLFPFHGESFVLYLSGHLRRDKLERISKRKIPSEQKNCLLLTFFGGLQTFRDEDILEERKANLMAQENPFANNVW
jgi:hypothetical protein